MSYFAGLLEGLDEQRRSARERETKEAYASQDREMAILSQLAQGDDDEIAAMAGAGMLEILSGNRKVTNAKGLRGFLGEVDRSSFLPQIQSALAARRASLPPTMASPGGAALPGASPVEPKAQGGAGQPPMHEMPMVSRQGLGVAPPPEMPATARAGLGLPGTGPVGGGTAGGPGGAGVPGLTGAAAPPPIPENAQQRYARLFPSAAQVAERARAAELNAKYTAALQALAGATTDQQRRLVMGMSGVSEAQMRPQAVNVTYINAMGVEDRGVGVMTADGQVEVDGQPVRVVQATPINQRSRAPLRARVTNTKTGLDEDVFYDQDTMEELQRIPLNRSTAPTYGGLIPMEGGGYGVIPRGAPPTQATPVRIPGAKQPPKGTTARPPDPKKSARAREAQAFAAEVKAKITARAKQETNPMTGVSLRAVTDAEKDAITTEVTQGAFTNYRDFLRAQQGLEGPGMPTIPAGVVGGFGSPEGANAISEALKRRQQR